MLARETSAARAASFERWVGRVVGERYRLVRFIGAGGMGAVFEAESERSGRRVAIKICERSRPNWERRARRVLREVRIASRVRHPNTIEVFRAGSDRSSGALFIVQELLHGTDLQQHLSERGTLSVAETLAIVLPIAEALEAVHLLGIVHRDVSPSNVFLARDGDRVLPKLIDFGLSRMVDDGERMNVTAPDEHVLGTPFYMSPEQARGDVLDARADLWSLGAILYRCLSGLPPHPASDVPTLFRKLATERPLPVDHHVEVPTQLAAIVHRVLEPERDRRFGDATELVRALRDACAAIEAPTPSTAFRMQAAAVSSTMPVAPRAPTIVRLPWVRAGAVAPPERVSSPSLEPPAAGRNTIGVVLDARGPSRELRRVSRALRESFGIATFDSYPRLIDALVDGAVELAWLPPVAFARAARAGAARALLTIERQGRRSHSCAIVARAEDAARGLDAVRGARVAWVDPWSAAGYLVPRRMLRGAGIDPDAAFRSQTFVGSHEAVVRALVERQVDVGAVHCRTGEDGEIVASRLLGAPSLRALAVGLQSIPGDVVCVSNALQPADARALAGRFLEAAEQPELRRIFRALWPDGRFVAANPSRYDGIADALAEDVAQPG